MESAEKIIETLKNSSEPMKTSEIAVATGIDKKIVDKEIKNLSTKNIIHSPKRCYYSMK
ncbi:MAG: MarR family transcriptional regulator [Bacteroidetes bacterium CG2_30_33_31]|nr:MAG: MarR family transcriptional regulator [Bacteroidetes bacterium CG2_30_33_31]